MFCKEGLSYDTAYPLNTFTFYIAVLFYSFASILIDIQIKELMSTTLQSCFCFIVDAEVECIFYFLHSFSTLLFFYTSIFSFLILQRHSFMNRTTRKWTSLEAAVDHSRTQQARTVLSRRGVSRRRRGSRVLGLYVMLTVTLSVSTCRQWQR